MSEFRRRPVFVAMNGGQVATLISTSSMVGFRRWQLGSLVAPSRRYSCFEQSAIADVEPCSRPRDRCCGRNTGGCWPRARRSARALAVHKRRPDALQVPNAFHITSRLGLVHGEDIATISLAGRRDPIVRDAVDVYRDVI
jgi:hypothetical protein